MPQFVPLDEAAAKIGVNPRTLYRWIKAGELKRFRGGIGDRKVYVDLKELRQLQKPRP
jgi:excisionase family DNA binding protein